MSSVSTFGAFTTARLGIYAAQKGLEVTGNNITNINTAGYSRQRLDQISLRTGGRDKYQSIYDANVGSGVLCTGVSQLRDPYLDIRYRNEQSNVGALDAKLSGLNELSDILDEVLTGTGNDGKFQAQISDILDQLDELVQAPNKDDGLVRGSAETLVKLLNDAANQLETAKKNQEMDFKQDIDTVNGILKSLGEINDSIMKSDIHGDTALELRDERNLLLDQLSQYVKIDVTYEPENVGAGITIERLVVKLAGSGEGNPDTEKSTLVNGTYATQLEMPEKVPMLNPNYDPDDQTSGKYIKVEAVPPDPMDPTDAGTPAVTTDDPKDAKEVDNTNYDLSLAALKDAKDRILELSSKVEYSGAYDSEADAIAGLGQYGLIPGTQIIEQAANGDITTKKYTVVRGDGTEANKDKFFFKVDSTTVSGSVALGDNDLYGAIQAQREMLTEAGEFTSKDVVNVVDPKAAIKRGIPYYQRSLDALANKFAEVLNEANTFYRTDKDGYLRDKDGNFLYIETDATTSISTIKAVKEFADVPSGAALKAEHLSDTDTTIAAPALKADVKKMTEVGGALFSNSSDGNDTTDIKAKNISISKQWSTSSVKIQTTRIYGEGSTASDNLTHIQALIRGDQKYMPDDILEKDYAVDGSAAYFTGNFAEMLVYTEGVLAKDTRITTTLLQNSASALDERYVARDSVMGVDLNDEAANMMMYQKSYAAACRLMTTLDEALDKLINGTGVVGR